MNGQPDHAVLITGANGGIGSTLCKRFEAAGYFVIATDRVVPEHPERPILPLDLCRFCDSETIRLDFASQVRSLLGRRKLLALINNAATQILGSVADVTSGDFFTTISVNVLAPLLLTQTFQDLLAQSDGAVINIGSVHAKFTKPRFVSYATSKSALHGLTRAMAVDLGGMGIRVNTIQPGAIRTPMLEEGFQERRAARQQLDSFQPVGRIGSPDEIAELALFLCSPQTKFITGAEFAIDGGIGVRLHDPD
jgi:NAD(P)-dependent dehydrogenase (short-subunit alcohol dehydrogenase family)